MLVILIVAVANNVQFRSFPLYSLHVVRPFRDLSFHSSPFSLVSRSFALLEPLRSAVDVVLDTISQEVALRLILEWSSDTGCVEQLERSVCSGDWLPWTAGSYSCDLIGIASDSEIGWWSIGR